MQRPPRLAWCLLLAAGCVGEPDLLGAPTGDGGVDAPTEDAVDAAVAVDAPAPSSDRPSADATNPPDADPRDAPPSPDGGAVPDAHPVDDHPP
ncbi:MAG: hypothetical protein JWM10_4626, partial [Myxococcaceae bacterium]|nr:hypothetical protein [Myxococcaceae bacterium]